MLRTALVLPSDVPPLRVGSPRADFTIDRHLSRAVGASTMASCRDLSRSIDSPHAISDARADDLPPREEIKKSPASNALSCCRIESLRHSFLPSQRCFSDAALQAQTISFQVLTHRETNATSVGAGALARLSLLLAGRYLRHATSSRSVDRRVRPRVAACKSQTASVSITSTKRSALKPSGYRLQPGSLASASCASSTP